MQGALEQLQKEFQGKIEFQARDFPLRDLTFRAAIASRCAGDQGKGHEMRRLLFNGQRQWGRSSAPDIIWENYAQATGVDVGAWRSCLESRKHQSDIEKDKRLGLSLGVEATPTIFVGNQKIVGAVPLSVLANAVQIQLRP